MIKLLRKLICPMPRQYFDRNGVERPVEEGIEELFKERDELVLEVMSLRKKLAQYTSTPTTRMEG